MKIKYVRTLRSMYDNNCVEVCAKFDGDKSYKDYRFNVEWLAQILPDYRFELEEKRVHTYLMNPEKEN